MKKYGKVNLQAYQLLNISSKFCGGTGMKIEFEGDERMIGNLRLLSFYVYKNLHTDFKMNDSG